MNPNYLDFEQPIAELEVKINELRLVGADDRLNISEEITKLEEKSRKLTEKIQEALDRHARQGWELVAVSHTNAVDSVRLYLKRAV